MTFTNPHPLDRISPQITLGGEASKRANEKYGTRIMSLKNATRHSLASRLAEEGQSSTLIARILGNSARVVERNYQSVRVGKVANIIVGLK